MTPREQAQQEAEKTFDAFMMWSKRVALWVSFLFISCCSWMQLWCS